MTKQEQRQKGNRNYLAWLTVNSWLSVVHRIPNPRLAFTDFYIKQQLSLAKHISFR